MTTIQSHTGKTIALMATLLVLLGWNGGDAAPRTASPASEVMPARQVYVEKILVLLEHKVADAALRTRAADKLATLSDRQLRLMAALSERIALVGEGPADGIALFLITALLILS